ncbi:hypothetical protein ACH5RR_033392 [Cinchona calisaya]|uniref:PCI domain-containing protein n=1 Tax=Cinchona calisaya TaxID=153742 RepID=A0ABD2YKU5_9GENT
MSFVGGFGKDSGPAASRNQNPYGNFPRPPSPTPPLFTRSPREPEAFEKIHSLPLAFESHHFMTSPSYPSAGFPSHSPHTWGNGQKFFYKDYDAPIDESSQTVVPSVSSSNFTIGSPSKVSQDTRRTRSPPSLSSDERILRNSTSVGGSRADLLPKSQNPLVPKQKQSPPLPFQRNSYAEVGGPPFGAAQQSTLSSPIWSDQLESSGNFTRPLTQPVISSVSTHITYDSRRKYPNKPVDSQVSKRSRSPNFPIYSGDPLEDTPFPSQNSHRPSTSPPKTRLSAQYVPPASQSRQQSPTSGYHGKPEVVANKPMTFPAAKKTKLPSLSSSDQVFQQTFDPPEDEINRESEAKAKRLMRFKDELKQPMESDLTSKNQRVPATRQHLIMMEKRKLNLEDAADMIQDSSDGYVPSDYECRDSSRIITGLCLDMCPESERAERERKGDLDQYERLDGDRNQTSISLAVKKYNRTAEREAEMIRPMPILQNTMSYLLNLLNKPYDDRFLGLYNFLWDRMRAIRMDLRMQHIFSLGAIKMLEQMIRLHIIAMHELCEYTKGEGFSEGFDAHLNIEQMNKTSVELFQLYDDHRKKGTNVATEKEFRGYYALLKLDKHPGYKVEPAELSLDLAKMTPDLRQTPEVMFARDVARACRTGNFIAFFKLARKASYLQACLMHAHFAKLRTQALAALHCGLQNNQGIPIAHVAKWLGMEEEDIEDLLEYHGYSVKEFEVPYMVKDGLFLNVDNDYPVKCSKLVDRKKSMFIAEDVSYPCLTKSSSLEEARVLEFNKGIEQKPMHIQSIEVVNTIQAIDEEMHDYASSPKDDMQVIPTPRTAVKQRIPYENQLSPASPRVWDSSIVHDSPRSKQNRIGSARNLKHDTLFRNSLDGDVQVESRGSPLYIMSETVHEANFVLPPSDSVLQNSVPEQPIIEQVVEEQQIGLNKEAPTEEVSIIDYDEEVAEAKLKLILRIWKRLSFKKRELREQKKLAANAALTSLSLGLPICRPEIQSRSSGDFNIDWIMSKRHEIREKSWSRLNVSEVVEAELSGRNPDSKCLCWKILLLTEDSSCSEDLGRRKEISDLGAGPWLLSKLLPTRDENDYSADLPISSPGTSIWKKWFPSRSGSELICCLTVIRNAKLENQNEALVAGASAIVFLVADSIPWELQRNRLHNVLLALPSGSSLPLLILSGSCKDNLDSSSIIKELRLHDIDKSRLSKFSVAFLKNQQREQINGFFSDEQLREGLKWLASESPSQPELRCMKTRELVLFHLNSSLEVLDDMDTHEVGPNQCISAFNDALDQSLRKVTAAVHANPNCWPCPEICLLEESSDEYKAISRYLPSLGWSSAARVEPLVHALSESKLPPFEDDISWLYRGSNKGNNIEEQRLQLENCLIKYFTDTSQMMGLPLASKEAGIMLQKFAQLQLNNSAYCIIPKWAMIFQRVFHWRLMNLSNDAFSSTYVLVQDDVSLATSESTVKTEASMPLPYLVRPSLDEMVAIGYYHPTEEMLHFDYGASQPCSTVYYSDSRELPKMTTNDNMEDEGRNVVQSDMLGAKQDKAIDLNNGGGSALAAKATNEADKLSELLDKCNILQSMIQEKLSIYF